MWNLVWIVVLVIVGIYVLLKILNVISYVFYKKRVLKSRRWDLNICCGATDGGGVNADIVKHKQLANFVLVDDIYNLPFKDDQFDNVLCRYLVDRFT